MSIVDGLIYGLILCFLYIGFVILTGIIIALINTIFYKICGNMSSFVCLFTGFIGTPIHELGHALFCLIFFHKIEEIKLFKPSSIDGTLGYVSHSYNKKNIYQRIGNFFIGVGPIIFGSLVLVLLLYIFDKNSFSCLNSLMVFYSTEVPESISMIPKFIIGGSLTFIFEFFNKSNFTSISWWIMIVISMFISLHMRLSKADISGAFSGLFFSVLLFTIPSIIISLIFPNSYPKYIGYMLGASMYVNSIYLLSITLALTTLAIALVIRIITKLLKK